MPARWTTVHQDSMADVLVLQGLLESNGFPTQLRDVNMKVIDPFITGSNALTVDLQVPDVDAQEASQVLAWRPDDAEVGDRSTAEERVEPVEEQVRKLGVQIRWASLMIISMPYALWLGFYYLRAVRRISRKPEGHGLTLAGLLVSLTFSIAACLALTVAVFATWADRR